MARLRPRIPKLRRFAPASLGDPPRVRRPLSLLPPVSPTGRVSQRSAARNPAQGKNMGGRRFIEIDGKRLLWRDLLKLRREQKQASAKAAQPALFALKDDRRPPAERTAAGRYSEPSLFSLPAREG